MKDVGFSWPSEAIFYMVPGAIGAASSPVNLSSRLISTY